MLLGILLLAAERRFFGYLIVVGGSLETTFEGVVVDAFERDGSFHGSAVGQDSGSQAAEFVFGDLGVLAMPVVALGTVSKPGL